MKKITDAPEGRARLLSFDGGGIRGLFALQYAKRIETLLREKSGNPDLVLADHFHYIGGTSTGAIIAAFLSWGLSVAEIEGLYRKNAIAMFTKAGWSKRFTSHKFVSEGLTNFPPHATQSAVLASGAQSSSPAEVFDGVWGLARSVLEASDVHAVARRLGLEVAA